LPGKIIQTTIDQILFWFNFPKKSSTAEILLAHFPFPKSQFSHGIKLYVFIFDGELTKPLVLQEQSLWDLPYRNDSRLFCCGNIVRGETKQHSEEWRTQILIFTLAGPDVYQCLSPEQRIHRIFKRQCRVSGYKECALP
jgi:hypothetical protein